MKQNIRLGAFVLISMAILTLFVFLVGNTQSKFQSNDRLQAQFQNVSGLEEGADVRIGGFRKGTVRKIVLPSSAEGKMTVVMDLSRQTRNLIRQDSVASIKSEGLVGNKYVEVSFGSENSPTVGPGGTIQSQPPLDISDLVAKTDKILDSTKGAVDNLQTATDNISTITAKINTGQGTVGALINDKTIYKEATAGAAALRADADALKHNFFLRGYFEKHGGVDPGELEKHSVAQLPGQPVQKAFDFEGKQVFDKPDSVKLKNEKLLNEAGQYLQSEKPGLVIIQTTAGPKGQADKLRQLSQQRAYAVRVYLLEHFNLDDQTLKIMAVGKSDNEPGLRIFVYAAGRG